jgi:hypothetical protein
MGLGIGAYNKVALLENQAMLHKIKRYVLGMIWDIRYSIPEVDGMGS